MVSSRVVQAWCVRSNMSCRQRTDSFTPHLAVKSANDETDLFEWKFKDGSVYQVKQEEHSCTSTVRSWVCEE